MLNEQRRIEFHFSPQMDGAKMRAVEKDDGGKPRRRYLYGITSGTKVDGTGERMTMKAIQSFHDQARSGDVLLYSGKHGVDFTDDIGRMVASSIDPEGNWSTEYRLYDEHDGFKPESTTLQKADKLWRQINGMAPYTHPRKKGFSVEGYIPETSGVVQMDQMGHRAMDEVVLDGVVCVSRPAVKDSVAMAVCKALGIQHIDQQRDAFRRALSVHKDAEDYFSRRLILDSTLEDQIERIVKKATPEMDDELRTLFVAYGDHLIPIIRGSESVFKDEPLGRGNGLNRAARRPLTRGNELAALGLLATRLADRLREGGLR